MKSFYACYLWLTTKAPDWLTDACAYHHHICYSLSYQALKTTLNCVRTLYRKYFEYINWAKLRQNNLISSKSWINWKGNLRPNSNSNVVIWHLPINSVSNNHFSDLNILRTFSKCVKHTIFGYILQLHGNKPCKFGHKIDSSQIGKTFWD